MYKGIPGRQTYAKYYTLFYKETAFWKWWIIFFLFFFIFKELESVAVLYILICTSFLPWWVHLFHYESQNNGSFQKMKVSKYNYGATLNTGFEYEDLHDGLGIQVTFFHH